MPEPEKQANARNVTGLVAGAGSGVRLGLGPKAFLELGKITLLRRVVETLRPCVSSVRVAVPEARLGQATTELAGIDGVTIVAGGASRQQSYQRLLEGCRTEYVVLRDVSRPFASAALICRVIEAARHHGAAAAFTPAEVSVGVVANGWVTGAIKRGDFMMPANPQCYRCDDLHAAFAHANEQGLLEASLWELLGKIQVRVKIVPGEATNVKISTPLDWEIARRAILPQIEDTLA